MAEVKVSRPAYEALVLAQEEAHRLNHSYIGTEHILLGLIGVAEGQAVKTLRAIRVEPAMVRAAVEFIVGKGERPPDKEVALTPRAERVIGLAMEQVPWVGRSSITTLDLLVALLREPEGAAAGILETLGVSLSRIARS